METMMGRKGDQNEKVSRICIFSSGNNSQLTKFCPFGIQLLGASLQLKSRAQKRQGTCL
jgi:hypothetical protein